MVKLVISSEFFGANENRNDIKKQLNSWGAGNIVFTDEGMIVAIMSEDSFENFMTDLKNKTNGFINEVFNKNDNIKSLSHDNSYINFNVVGSFTEDDMKMIANEICMAVSSYQIFNGIPQNETAVTVIFRKRKRGKIQKVIDTSKSGKE